MTDRPQAAHPSITTPPSSSGGASSRREFLTGSTAGLAGLAAAATVASTFTAPLVHAAGSSTIKIGLVGCGGRGSGAAEQALTADSGTKLVAMADAFQDRIDEHLSTIKGFRSARASMSPKTASTRASTPTRASSTRSTSSS